MTAMLAITLRKAAPDPRDAGDLLWRERIALTQLAENTAEPWEVGEINGVTIVINQSTKRSLSERVRMARLGN
jgi:hypothetical protein